MTSKSTRAKRVRIMDIEEFAAKCISLLDEVYEHDIEVVITRNGEPIARMIRYVEEKAAGKTRPKSK